MMALAQLRGFDAACDDSPMGRVSIPESACFIAHPTISVWKPSQLFVSLEYRLGLVEQVEVPCSIYIR